MSPTCIADAMAARVTLIIDRSQAAGDAVARPDARRRMPPRLRAQRCGQPKGLQGGQLKRRLKDECPCGMHEYKTFSLHSEEEDHLIPGRSIPATYFRGMHAKSEVVSRFSLDGCSCG